MIGVLGGMGPLATVDFFSKVLQATPAKGDADHVPLLMLPDQPPYLAKDAHHCPSCWLDGIALLPQVLWLWLCPAIQHIFGTLICSRGVVFHS
jgi:hypothetical protein